MAEDRNVILSQPEGERLRHEADVTLQGDCDRPPIKHDVAHFSSAERPLVHMVCWEEEGNCRVAVDGSLTLRGDEKSPVQVRMDHAFQGVHHQTHVVAPLDHSLNLRTALAQPIHHALQMRTPLQLRFCNPWHIASDYQLEIRFGDNQLATVRLTGATVATPQPCEDPCAEPVSGSDHP